MQKHIKPYHGASAAKYILPSILLPFLALNAPVEHKRPLKSKRNKSFVLIATSNMTNMAIYSYYKALYGVCFLCDNNSQQMMSLFISGLVRN